MSKGPERSGTCAPQSELPVRLFDVVDRRRLVDAEHGVNVFAVVDFRRGRLDFLGHLWCVGTAGTAQNDRPTRCGRSLTALEMETGPTGSRGGAPRGRGGRGGNRGRGRGASNAGDAANGATGTETPAGGNGRGGPGRGANRGRSDRGGGRGQRGHRGGASIGGPAGVQVAPDQGQGPASNVEQTSRGRGPKKYKPSKPAVDAAVGAAAPGAEAAPAPAALPKQSKAKQAAQAADKAPKPAAKTPMKTPVPVKELTTPFNSYALDLLDLLPKLPSGTRSLLDHVASVHRKTEGTLQVLMVAEKPSVAEAIAKALSGGRHSTVRSTTPIHTFNLQFLSRPATIHVTAVTGHLFSIDFPPQFNNWNTVDPAKLFECPTERVEQRKGGVVSHIKECAKGMDALALWLDGDREGENIAFQVWNVAKNGLKNSKLGRDCVFRARFSALTPQEIRHAYATLDLPNPNLALAVDVRQEIDLRIGCAFTRFQTKYFQGRYGNLDSTTVSFGPCQTPTLALCVRRHDEILSFVPKSFWTLTAKLDAGRTLVVRGRKFLEDRTRAEKALLGVKAMKAATIESVSPKTKSLPPPAALDTVKLLQLGSSLLHMSPQEVMRYAEALYINGYISYPRTETSRYPDTFDLAASLREIARDEYAAAARSILDSAKGGKVPVPNRGKDKGDHPPITPMRYAPEGELYGSERRVYDLVCRMFLGSLMGPLKYERTTVTVKIGSEEFKTSGRRLVDRGWAAACHWIWGEGGRSTEHDLDDGAAAEEGDEEDEEEDEGILPADLVPGKSFSVDSVSLQQGLTKPPGYLTESQLVALMDKLGIGTDASMATHIANVIDRGYVRVGGNRREMIPTELGIVLVHGYQQIDPDLALPTLRSSMEAEIAKIAEGTLPYSQVLAEQLELYTNKFRRFVLQITGMDSLFEASFSSLSDSGKVMGRCGICKRYTKYLPLRPQRIHCATCQRTYDLPPNGNIKLYREQTCPIDGFELVYFTTGAANGRSFVLCPKCYNEPPVEGISAPMSCTQCTVATCPHSLARNGLFPCPNVVGGSGARGTSGTSGGVEKPCDGTVCLDGTSAPRWKLSCNACNFAGIFNESVHGVSISSPAGPAKVPNIEDAASAAPAGGVCEDCGAVLINISFGKKAGKEDMVDVCVVCDEEDLEGVLEARLVRLGLARSRGRGRGRGRRGRGRGRGGHRRQRSDDGPAFGGAEGKMMRKNEGPSLGAFLKF